MRDIQSRQDVPGVLGSFRGFQQVQTKIHPSLAGLPGISEAEATLRRCVHCGFCTATCPTYQLLGDELDGPRGRIYLIKNLLETNEISAPGADHLDRCLTCRACETTCPSGVEYGRLLDVGREVAQQRTVRPWRWRLLSAAIRLVVPRPWLFRPLFRLGLLVRPLLPQRLQRHLPRQQQRYEGNIRVVTPARHDEKPQVLLLSGCVQSAATPGVVHSLQRLLSHKGMTCEIVHENCCGALDLHLSAHEKARQRMRALIDLIWPRLDEIEAVVSSATGCAVTLQDYPVILADDPVYRDRAEALATKLRDPVQLLRDIVVVPDDSRLSVQTPCSMQHGMKLGGTLDNLLKELGFEVLPQRDGHLCCGSAGAYSILQPDIADELRSRKLARLQAGKPDVIVTANIGCQLHLAAESGVPVKHWLEFLADRLPT